jgi:hypothetical protein
VPRWILWILKKRNDCVLIFAVLCYEQEEFDETFIGAQYGFLNMRISVLNRAVTKEGANHFVSGSINKTSAF